MNPIKSVIFRIRSTRKWANWLIILTLAAAGLFAINQPGTVTASSTLTFSSVADSYVNQSSPSTNYGTDHSLRTDGSPIVNSYLRFDISGIGTNQVAKVTLKIYANSSSQGGISVKKISDNNWQETKVTYQNAPVIGAQVGKSSSFSGGTWVSVDVTSLLNADGTINLALVGNDSTAINLASKENTTHKPQLLIVVNSVATPTTTQTKTIVPSATATATATKTNTPQPTVPSGGDHQPGFPIRAAFYYPWFPEAWNQLGYDPYTNYNPALGLYDSSSISVIDNQIQAMTYGNINAAILSWWGQGTKTDQRVSTLLGATPGSSNPNFRWSIYYELEVKGDPTVSQIQSDLSYLQSKYGNDPSLLRVNNKFVVFIDANANDSCGMADRWVQADNGLSHPAYIVLKVFSGFRTCASQPDSWHQYGPAAATDEQKGYSYTISPGFWEKGETSPRLPRDLTTWANEIKSMIASGDPWQLITTFNEWDAGTSVESAKEWASASGFGQYLDVLHDNGNGNIPAQSTATTKPTNPPISTSTPTSGATQVTPPSATATRTPPPTLTPTGQATNVPTATPVPATPTIGATQVTPPSATATHTPPPTLTPTGQATKVPTATPIPATPTSSATQVTQPSATATHTPPPTLTPTGQATKVPTATPLPPTPTRPAPTATQSSNLTPVTLTKGPDLLYSGSNTNMKLFWQWTANTTFRVDWGTSSSYGASSPAISAYDTTNHLYAVTITGLTPATKYYYRVVVGNQYSGGSFLTAPADSATTVNFVSYGDNRTNPSIQNTLAGMVDQLFQSDPSYQTFNLVCGDLVSSGDTDSVWTSEMFSPSFTNIRTELANLPYLPIMGNHEGSGSLFQRYFPQPYVAAAYWSFDYGPVHVVLMDQYTSYGAGSAEYNWVKSDLAATTKKWKVVMFHEPGYSANGGHPDNTTIQTVYEPLFEQYKVALVLAGHNHYYARAMVNGIPELTVGTGGAPLYTPQSGQLDIVKTYQGNGYEKISISGNTLTGWFIASNGSTIDTFSVTR